VVRRAFIHAAREISEIPASLFLAAGNTQYFTHFGAGLRDDNAAFESGGAELDAGRRR
jgi:hypothetical protein